MSTMRILVVDDDPDLLFLVAHGVKSLGPNFQVTTAADGPAALEQMQKHPFDLVITDYMMPDMTGLELVQAAREILPQAKFILMTAHHDTSHVRDTIQDAELSGFVSKPFTVPELLDVVKNSIAQMDTITRPAAPQVTSPAEAIKEQLQTLHRRTGAHSVLLVNSNGSPVYRSGHLDQTKSARLGAFVSANFLAVAELATLFGDNESAFRSSYYEGSKYNIYAHDINGEFFLAVVFGAGGKPGTVWFYTKQTAVTLAAKLPKPKHQGPQQDTEELAKDFDDILGDRENLDH